MQHSEVIKLNKLGEGGFGKVYKCCSGYDDKKFYALKKIPLDKEGGISCLTELYIMYSFKHKSLSKSIATSIYGNSMNILQEFAPHGDLKEWRQNNVPTKEKIRVIIHNITTGLDFLHRNGFIHGDIKPNNILSFDNNHFKISDFGLCLKLEWNNKYKSVCTSSYKPPEVLLKKKYNEKVDIWSLGCVLYEIIFGFKIFPHQGCIYNTVKDKRKNRDNIIAASLNAITDWIKTGHVKGTIPYKKDLKIRYIKLDLPNSFAKNEMNKLMFEMLEPDPKLRFSTKDIFNHLFMNGTNKDPNKNIVITKPDIEKYYIFRQELNKFTRSNDIINESVSILSRYLKSNYYKKVDSKKDNNTTKITAFYMAYKIITRFPMETKTFIEKFPTIKLKDVIKKEKEICTALFKVYF